MKTGATEILKRNQLSITESRKKILELFNKTSGALSHAAIEKLTATQFDRVTIYRTLQTFVEKGIVHTIPTTDNSVLYAVCKNDCSEGHHHDEHVHFICDVCGNTYCLQNVEVPALNLPKGFSAQQVNMIVSGVCSDCK